jgi:hypothetical protein
MSARTSTRAIIALVLSLILLMAHWGLSAEFRTVGGLHVFNVLRYRRAVVDFRAHSTDQEP